MVRHNKFPPYSIMPNIGDGEIGGSIGFSCDGFESINGITFDYKSVENEKAPVRNVNFDAGFNTRSRGINPDNQVPLYNYQVAHDNLFNLPYHFQPPQFLNYTDNYAKHANYVAGYSTPSEYMNRLHPPVTPWPKDNSREKELKKKLKKANKIIQGSTLTPADSKSEHFSIDFKIDEQMLIYILFVVVLILCSINYILAGQNQMLHHVMKNMFKTGQLISY